MYVREPECSYDRFKHVLNLPITARCAELTVLLDRATIIELQGVFPYLVENIFGPQGEVSWNLRGITSANWCEESRQLLHFLSPCGPLFKTIYTLLKDPATKYNFSLTYLPSKVRQILDNASAHSFYSDLVHVNPQNNQVLSLRLNPFDYYMFHFGYYLINPWHQRSSTINYSWNTVYYELCCNYMMHFLPTDTSPVLPLINYNGKNPYQTIPPIQRKNLGTSLLSPKVLNKSVEDYSFHQNLDKHPRNEIWRSESVLTIFIDIWLYNDQISSQNQSLNNSLNLSYNNPSVMPFLHYNELPTGEYMRIVRVLIKQIHAFSASANADDTHLGELKKNVIPMVQGKFYVFIRNLVHRWPLDGSFRLVLELWLSYIQPWRYPPDHISKPLNIKPPNPDAEDIALVQSSPVDQHYLPFIVDNLLAYVVIFQQLLPRFSRVDLVSPKMATMLYRITKVFNQPNLVNLLKEVENCVENNHSPSHSYNNPHWTNSLPPLSPTSTWSTNTMNTSGILKLNSSEKHTYTLKQDTSSFCKSYISGQKKWACAIKQKIYELEGPTFCYKPLFTKPPASEVFDIIYHLKKSISISQQIINQKKQEHAKQFAGVMGFIRGLFEAPVVNDEFSLNDRMKVPSYLEFSLNNLIDIFEINEVNETEQDLTQNRFDVSNDLTFLTPSKVKERVKKIKYEGDPDLMPIMSTENTFLVRVLYQLALKINEQFGLHFSRLYSLPTFKGRLTRQLLCEPITVFSYDKTVQGSPRVAKRLPPRVSFRQLASYKFLVYFFIGAVILKLFGYGFVFYTIFVLFFYFILKCIKAIPRRHMYPTEGFCNIIFNGSF